MLPELFLERMKKLLGSEFDAFLGAYERPRNVGLRRNPLKAQSVQLPAAFGLSPVAWAENGYYYDAGARPGLSPLHEAGAYYLQEPSAMAPAALLDAQPDEHVLDLCAAPGGKSTQLAAAMRGRGLLVCNEINHKRAKILSSNIERMGIANALVLNEHPQRLEARFAGYFDRVLVDAPCSGEGMFRKEEAAVSDWSPQTVDMCAARQLEILHSAAAMLRAGGRLVYSTCTFAPQENEGTISAFLHTHPEFYLEKLDAPWFSAGRPDWVESPAEGLEHTFRLWPHRLRGEGHYAAVLRKHGAAARAALRPEPAAPMPKEVTRFCAETGAALPEGKPVLFGDTVYLAPENLPELKGLRVLRAGLALGTLRKGRLEPAHAWALWLREAKSMCSFPAESDALRRFMAGETLDAALRGWTLVCCEGLTLGWAKGDGTTLKNHYPKALRRPL